ncbi:tRNA-dihydrouridine synthase 3 [Galdieria sulphuraria]|uniref:tRNA-dihydrouridine(47) synthase [NAD(P)(+)] n=1 Tax=Galdieria sulphuraria TaxID=130081 RepID=M2W7J3_GALSU|nr:tRNA-dihydrouridine synthase 3 [Galdieria sulphuraria]EME31786.1 tRNA-dihydrouridine synthase 3 [Galdieria sulphuraria]|eukprot:XP_005708306.1 tRNA-dihydrouridine synthase 3 [Galdieria sulphuraria]
MGNTLALDLVQQCENIVSSTEGLSEANETQQETNHCEDKRLLAEEDYEDQRERKVRRLDSNEQVVTTQVDFEADLSHYEVSDIWSKSAEERLESGDAPVFPDHLCYTLKTEEGSTLVINRERRLVFYDRCLSGSFPYPDKAILDGASLKPRSFHFDINEERNYLSKELQRCLRKRQYYFDFAERDRQSLLREGCSFRDSRNIDLEGKLYLAPLTTLGNLPFRRICKHYGADITCGEMALSANLLQGQQSEWALLRRHREEDLFGIQIAGSKPEIMARAAQLTSKECDIDFIDINAGCPIELLCKKGGGCELLRQPEKLGRIMSSMVQVVDKPVFAKIRLGISQDHLNALKTIQILNDAGASAVTIHGRTKLQRYSKKADWEYLYECAQLGKEMSLPIIGNGDIYTYEDIVHLNPYSTRAENSSPFAPFSAVMIGRGALIKPWIFTELKEQRHWDISASERLEIIQTFAKYGLDHWGADKKGVERTRKFLLEWLSFLHRYAAFLVEHNF